MGKRKSRSRQINVQYLKKQLHQHFDGSIPILAKAADITENTIRTALRGKPISDWAVGKICKIRIQGDVCIDKIALTSLGDQISLHSIKESLGYHNRSSLKSDSEASIDKDQESKKSVAASVGDDESLQPKILTFVSVKGGVGKTTLAINTAVELATKLRVALVDLDLFTFGATSWFKQQVFQEKSPLTFIDLALGSNELVSERVKLAIPIENNIDYEPTYEFCFIPAFGNPDNITEQLTPPPILIDWSMEDAREAVESSISRLVKMDFDVIVLDSHPGFHSLTDTICTQADCNILVSDFDDSTLYANWMLGWQIEHRKLLRENIGSDNDSVIQKPTWRIAINRIPSHESTRESIKRAEKVWQLAVANWSKCDFNSLQSQNVQTGFKEPVLLLPDMENLRLDRQDALQPTSFAHRGGTFIVVATRSMIRCLVLEGVLGRFESDFSYADSRNHAAQEAMDNFLGNNAIPWKPGWIGIYLPMGIPLLVSIALLVADGIFMALVPSETILNENLPNFTLGTMSIILFNLWIYAMSRLMREVIRACDRVEQYITVLSNRHLSRFEQLQSYNEAAKADKGVSETRLTILFLWMVGFFPGAILATMQLIGLESLWLISNYVTTAVVLTLMLWPVAGKASVFRVFFTGCYYLVRTKFRRLRSKKLIQKDSSRKVAP